MRAEKKDFFLSCSGIFHLIQKVKHNVFVLFNGKLTKDCSLNGGAPYHASGNGHTLPVLSVSSCAAGGAPSWRRRCLKDVLLSRWQRGCWWSVTRVVYFHVIIHKQAYFLPFSSIIDSWEFIRADHCI